MKYRQILPPDYLSNYVQYFWTLESSVPTSFGTIADGCPGLIFQQSGGETFYQNEKHLPGFFLYGQATKFAEINSPEKFSTIGICFYPHALKSVFGLNAHELTDSCLDFNLFSKKQGDQLYERLLNSTSVDDQIEFLSQYLRAQINLNTTDADEIIQYSLSQIVKSKGGIPLKDLHDDLQLSERSFERKFKQSIGISPKLYARICRFKVSLNQLKNNDFQKLSDIAYENDYSDQSHFIRSFKEFAGFSPLQYPKLVNVVIENTPTQ
ncbi:helix-turn-helix transcriptional regulator [Solitalea canadensis]|uniref:HTH araC/xylS-type domain-containing protein n=1 Tax=Solitalea canadensis (strain ATCC 29591 / DSM 3403 / JCM 21819 / LMG 8368 / NBRC 15130 / NCIMB 12057 / USAM 9D) TaxID=929556 RepID=H8KQI8_SOLCM|nr:helix-turn-helix transcriptional regulator [Solitalea canadensis]AFD06726.1 hypothetical protein Solca_1660 [Solitalea canadensis DSM 3403]